MRLINLIFPAALALTSFVDPALATEPPPSIDTWEVIGEANTRVAALRNLVPAGEGEQPTRMAREYRFKGVAEGITAAEAMEQKRTGFLKSCRAGMASDPSTHKVAGYEAVVMRFDCPAMKKGGRQTIFMTAWVERYDLQTKEVMFTAEPSDAEVAMAMAFLRSPAAASVPRR